MHLFSLATPFVPVVANIAGNIIGIVLSLFASISYLIVWSIWAYLKTHDSNSGRDDCGLKGISGIHNYKMG
jgi:hypothetical protein